MACCHVQLSRHNDSLPHQEVKEQLVGLTSHIHTEPVVSTTISKSFEMFCLDCRCIYASCTGYTFKTKVAALDTADNASIVKP